MDKIKSLFTGGNQDASETHPGGRMTDHTRKNDSAADGTGYSSWEGGYGKPTGTDDAGLAGTSGYD